MDNTKELTVVEWFTGYGGNELGLKRVIPTMRPIAFCERESFVVANLVAKMEAGLMDPVPVWSDATTFPAEPFKDRVGLFIASYPCQPFSHAGKRDGQNDERHLWPACRRFVQGARPRFVFFENVEGHVTLGLSTVLSDLEEDGYAAAWGIFSASEVGAPHQRKRVFILAYDKNSRTSADKRGIWEGISGIMRGEGTVKELARPGERQYAWEPPRVVCDGRRKLDDAMLGGPERKGEMESGRKAADMAGERVVGDASSSGYEPVSKLREELTGRAAEMPGQGLVAGDNLGGQTQPPMGGNADGPPDGLDFPRCTGLSDTELEEIYGWMVKGTNRTDELRMCGNGVVPATAERAFRVLYAELTGLAGANTSILG